MKHTARRKANRYENWLTLAILAVTITAGNVLAHNVLSSVSVEDSIPVSSFCYADGAALSYAEVKVWAPNEDEVEFQNGRTDKNGKVSFIPDREGVWRVEVADGLGHAATVEFEAKSEVKTRLSDKKTENVKLLYVILGVSLLFNLTFLIQKIIKLKET